MSRKESKFYAINFIDARIFFLKKKILTPRVMKTHIQKSKVHQCRFEALPISSSSYENNMLRTSH